MNITERIKENKKNIMDNRPIVIGFLGDSLTQGCFELYNTSESSLETEYRSYEAYHGKLKRMLEEIFPSVPINIINAGISGDCAVSGRARLKRDILDFHPDLVVVSYGLNDVGGKKEGISQYAKALETIFTELQMAGIETIFMTPNMMGTRVSAEITDPYNRSVVADVTSRQTEGWMDIYMEKAREICAKKNVPVCDCYAKWKKLEENGVDITRLLANRANHPTEKMHWLFAVSLFEMIMGF